MNPSPSSDPRAGPFNQTLVSDARELRREAQKTALAMMALMAWFAFGNAALGVRDSPWPTSVGLSLLAGTVFGGFSFGRHPRLTSALIAGSLCGAYLSLVAAYPDSPMRYAGVLVLIICSSVLSDLAYGVLTLALCLVVVGLQVVLPRAAVAPAEVIHSAAFLVICSVGLAVSRHHLATALTWASESAQSARELTDALRARQLSLNRALRSMEEATWRVERLNNELLLARHEAEAARVAKERFASTVSHEMRGPLNLILGFSQLMALSPERYGADLSNAFYADVDTVYRNTQHLCNLVDDVLDLSRIEAEHLPVIRQSVDIESDVIAPVLGSVCPLAEHKSLFLREELAPDMPAILADPVRLRQVLLNLLINSLRFTTQGGITIRVENCDREMVVSVADTGPGIAAKDIPRLFREFEQLDVGGNPGAGGSGLGLSIAKHLVEAHGGRIWAESELGAGTTIRFSLPRLDIEPSRKPLQKTPVVQYRVTEHSDVLVVHPDPEVITLMQRYLEDYRIVGVLDVAQVGELVERLHPRAVLTSTELGERVLSAVSGLPYDTPVISCGLPDAQNRDHPQGVSGYLVKPVRAEILQPYVRRAVREGMVSVMVVDDDPDEVRLLEIMIQSSLGISEVIKAYSGQQALQMMAARRPNIVFLDWLMPGLDGMETVARMRADQRLRDIPVVIVSARDPVEGPRRLQMPLTVHCRGSVSMAVGAECLQGILRAIRPSYLEDPEPAPRPVAMSDR